MKKRKFISNAVVIIIILNMFMMTKEVKAETFTVKEFYKNIATSLEKTDENWEFQVGPYRNDGKKNLYVIKKQAGNNTEIHIMSESTNYQEYCLHRILPVEATGSDVSFRIGDYNGDGNTDLYMIKKQVGNHTEIHVLDGANEFQTFLVQKALPVEATDSTTDFEVGDYNGDGKDDLYMIKKQAGGKTEVHVLKAENGFSDFYIQVRTALHSVGDDWEFGVSDYDNDKIPDVYCVNKQGSNSTDVHVLKGVDGYQSYLVQTDTPLEKVDKNYQICITKDKFDIFAINKQGDTNTEIRAFREAERNTNGIDWYNHTETALEKTDENWEFQVGSYRNDGKKNLYVIKKQAGNNTEIHIMSESTNYQEYCLHRILPVEATGSDVSFRIGDYNGDGYTDLYMIKKQVGSHTEIHVLDGSNEFQTFLLQKALPVEATDSTTDFEVGDYNGDGKDDLYMIKKQAGGKTEVHVLKAENGFSDFYLQIATVLHSVGDDWEFGISDYDNDKIPDVYCVNKQGTYRSEVHVLKGGDGYQSYLLHSDTPLEKADKNYQICVAKGKLDIFVIKKQAPTKTEVHAFRMPEVNNDDNDDDNDTVEKKREAIVNEALYWKGKIPYKSPSSYNYKSDVLNKNSIPSSMDCSDFTSAIYATVLEIRFQDYTGTQMKCGIGVDINSAKNGNYTNLKKGDLIIFTWPNGDYTNGDHVGIYIGDGEFIHESGTNSKGGNVKITSLDANWGTGYGYVRSNIISIRRIIN